MKKTRGLRNNNPLNIRRNNTRWKGLSPKQPDKSFFTFTAPEWGYRAAIITLRNYSKIHKLNTLAQWVSRWAPPTENDTDAYIRFVCNKSDMSPETTPDIYNKTEMCAIVSAMSYMENGTPAIETDVDAGWRLSL